MVMKYTEPAPPTPCVSDLINVEADGVQVGIRPPLVQVDPHNGSCRHRRLVAHCEGEAGILPVRQEVPASPGRPSLHPRALEVGGLPLAICWQRQRRCGEF